MKKAIVIGKQLTREELKKIKGGTTDCNSQCLLASVSHCISLGYPGDYCRAYSLGYCQSYCAQK